MTPRIQKAAERIKELLTGSRVKLAVAESLTAGMIQSALASVSGSSSYFEGGITAYQLRHKVDLLDVDEREAAACNCVSAEIAEQMAAGAAKLFKAHIAIATTGYAEPWPLEGVKTPHAYWCVFVKLQGGQYTLDGQVDGLSSAGIYGRSQMREAVTCIALEGLVRVLENPEGAALLGLPG